MLQIKGHHIMTLLENYMLLIYMYGTVFNLLIKNEKNRQMIYIYDSLLSTKEASSWAIFKIQGGMPRHRIDGR